MQNNDRLRIAKLGDLLKASRYVINLSTSSSLVLFKLSHLPDRSAPDSLRLCSDGKNDYYCMNQECPHAGGPMEDSELTYDVEDDAWVASCPWHSYDFNVQTGESSFGVKTCTYPVTIEDGSVYIQYPRTHEEISISSVLPVSETFRPSLDSLSLADAAGAASEPSNDLNLGKLSIVAPTSVTEWCVRILNTPDSEKKAMLTHQLFECLQEQPSMTIGTSVPPSVPPRHALKAIPPTQMPKPGRAGTLKSRIAILHSLANIEQWAIDLALDICARFASFRTSTGAALPQQFFLDWLRVANDEAKHFSLLRGRLRDLGSDFGALPVHHGLWDSAAITAHDLRARISIIALVHEARGLDVNPATIRKFENAEDAESVEALKIIHADEVTHVTTGHRWLTWICEQEGTDPITVFRENVKKYFMGAVKGPFNVQDRKAAGLDEGYYVDLNGRPKTVLVAGG